MKRILLLSLLFLIQNLAKTQNCFTSASNYTSPTWPSAVYSADFNNDGNKDIISGNVTTGNLRLYLGSSTGTFSPGTSIPLPNAPWDLVGGDFNGDGKLDLAAACSGSTSIVILLGTGLGTFSSTSSFTMTSPQVVSLSAGDFNNDGKLDIVAEDFNVGLFYIVLGNGSGSFGAATSFTTGGTNPYAICSGDFNNDGNRDVAVANGVTNNVGILFGTGTGSFVFNSTYSVGPFPQDIICADFNNDGKPDLATADINGGSISILIGSSSGTFAPAVAYPAGSTGVTALKEADINGDGSLDIVGANWFNSYVEVYLNNGSGVFSTPRTYTVGTNPNAIYAADFNNDGKPDIVTSNKTSNDLSVLLNYSFAITATPVSPTICAGQTATISASAAVGYTWSTGSNNQSITPSPGSNTSYTVFAKTAQGCTNTAVTSISVIASPTVLASSSSTLLCLGNTVTLTATGADTYTWNPGGSAITITQSPGSTTVYSVTGTSTLSGCNNTALQTVSVVTASAFSISTINTVVCTGGSRTLTASGGVSYTWFPGAVASPSLVVSPTVTSSYSVNGITAGGCTATAVQTIDLSTIPCLCNGYGASGATNSGGYTDEEIFNVVFGTLNNASTCTTTAPGLGSLNQSYSNYAGFLSSPNVCPGQSVNFTVNVGTCVGWYGVQLGLYIDYNQNGLFTDAGEQVYYTGTAIQGDNIGSVNIPFSALPGTTRLRIVAVESGSAIPVGSYSWGETEDYCINVLNSPTIVVNSGSICSGQAFTITPSGANSYTYSAGSNIVGPTVNTNYSVTGTSVSGCVSASAGVSSVTVHSNPTITATSGSICSGSSFTIVPAGASAYTISGGLATVSPTSTTSYTVTGTSSVGCLSSNTAIATVSVNTSPTISVNSGSICSGQSFTLLPAGASTYTISGGSSIVSPLVTTSYSVSGTSSLGCVSVNTAVSTITVNITPTLSVNSGSICVGQNFTIVPSGASSYTYSPGSNIVGPLVTTSYSVTGTSAQGCAASNTAVCSITVNANPTITANSGSICSGNFFVIVPSGASSYTVSGSNFTVSPSTSTAYSVTGTSSTGCVSGNTAIATVTVNASPTIAVNSGSLCTGQSFTINPSGAATYTYSGGTAVVSPTVNTSYSVSGTSSLGCVSTNTVVSNVTAFVTPTISVNSGSICVGQNFTMVPTGANSYTYSAGSNIVGPLITTNYSVTGTSTAGCVATNTAVSSITVNTNPTVSVNSGSMCTGNSFTIIPSNASTYTISGSNFIVSPASTSSYSVTGTSAAGCVSGNTAVATITVFTTPTVAVNSGSICSGNTFVIVPTNANSYTVSGANFTVSPASTTSYSVSGSSTAGCVSFNTAVCTVTVFASPTLAVNSGSICSGNSFVIVPNNASTYTISGTNFTVSPTVTTSYSITGTSAVGCLSTNTVVSTVTVFATPTIAVNSGSICSGNNFVIVPTNAITYTISGNNFTVSPATTTSYTVSGSSSAGCLSGNTVVSTVTVSASPTVAVNSGSMCSGGSFVIVPSNATTYTISGGSFTVSPTVASSYSVTGSSTAGCISSNTAICTITVQTSPTITVNSGSICSGSVFSMVPSGASSYTYSGGQSTVSPTLTSTYSVSGTSSLGCISLMPAVSTVTVYALPNLQINGLGTICKGGSATYTATGAISYTWSTGANSNTLAVSPTISTIYTLTGTSANGCGAIVQQSLTVASSKNLLGSVTSGAGQVNGNVVLYKYTPFLKKWDSLAFSPVGGSSFLFTTIDSGLYVLRAVPTATSMYETYGSSASSWKGANIIAHGCSANTTHHIIVKGLTPIGNGPGVMAGKIYEGKGYGHKTTTPGNPIGGITVKGGKNPGGNIVGRAVTDANGNYSITNLPANDQGEDYFILVDIPGLDTNGTYRRILLTGSETFYNLDFIVDSIQITPVDISVGVKEFILVNSKLQIYPNPNNGKLNIEFSLIKSAEISVELMDMNGRLIKTVLASTKQEKGDISLRAQLNEVKPGMYFIKIKVGDEERLSKLVVTD